MLFRNHPLKWYTRLAASMLVVGGFSLSTVANDAIDLTTTGSVGSAVVQQASFEQSAGYSQALALVKSDPAQAYAMARGFSNNLERRVIQWAAIYYGDGAIDHNSVKRFWTDAPDYVTTSVFKRRLEQALTKTDAGKDEVISLLGGEMPRTLDAQLALAAAYVADGQVDRGGRIAQSMWVNSFMNADYEQRILRDFGSLLTNEHHWQRVSHLLMHDRARAAERIANKLTAAQNSLAQARIAVARKAANANQLLDRVDPQYRNHHLFHFARGQHARRAGNLVAAVKFLDQADGNFPDSAEFWYERRLIVRRAIAADQYQTAYAAAAGYTEGPEGRLVEARFHAGWVAQRYLKDAATARSHFEKMTKLSTLPDSVTQAYYWLGQAHKSLGQSSEARKAFEAAAPFNTRFYGQLARLELGIKSVGLRSMPEWRGSVAVFENRELVRAVRLLSASGQKVMAEPLVRILAWRLDDPGEMLLTARLAQSIDAHNVAILVADRAERRGTPLDLFNFPKDGLPSNAKFAAVDRAAVYAVARQESKFDVDAISRSDARGLMQLMPSTAKDVARKVGVSFSESRLTSDGAYNTQLGSAYLAQRMSGYDGSLVLAAAAYNAGAGNVNKWLKQFGDPRDSRIDPVSWIERIPFVETRKYTQRVMANYMVYRARFGDESLTIADALRRIPH